MQAFDVYLSGKNINTVFYTRGHTVEEVKQSLISHDGYNPNIVVRKAK